MRRRRGQVLLLALLLRLLMLQQRRHVLRHALWLPHIRRHRGRVRLAPAQVVSVDRRCQAQRRQRRQGIRRKVATPGAKLGSADVPKPQVPRWASASIGGVLQVHKSRHQRIAGAASMRGGAHAERHWGAAGGAVGLGGGSPTMVALVSAHPAELPLAVVWSAKTCTQSLPQPQTPPPNPIFGLAKTQILGDWFGQNANPGGLGHGLG